MQPATMIKRYKGILLYIIFGGCTTLVNLFSYYFLAHITGLQVVPATVLAWLLSVVFAYITNKIWVFESRSFALPVLLREAASFFAARIFSGVLDLGIMWVCVDLLGWNDLVVKILSNIIVVVLNYLFSKFWIFKRQ